VPIAAPIVPLRALEPRQLRELGQILEPEQAPEPGQVLWSGQSLGPEQPPVQVSSSQAVPQPPLQGRMWAGQWLRLRGTRTGSPKEEE